MHSFLKKKKWLLTLCCALVVILAAGILLRCFVYQPSSQSDYPELPRPGASVIMFEPTSIEQLYENSDLIVEATVTEVKDPVTTTLEPQGPNAGKLEGTRTELTIYDFQLHIEDVLLVSAPSEEITLSRGLLADAEPPLEVGDRMIFFLCYNSLDHTYGAVDPHTGYYYLAHDNKVYPGEVTKATEFVSGMNVNQFKQQIRDYAAAHPNTESE